VSEVSSVVHSPDNRQHVVVASGTGGPEREVELANDAMGDFDLDGAVAHLSAAIRQFTAAAAPRRAAMACVRLGDVFANYMGNMTAARAWFARAARLVEGDPCVEQGWAAVAAMGCDVDDPAVLLANAELALDRARQFGDVNLETKALADAGLAHVQAGRLTEGMALLDEAMALACGAADDSDAAGKSVCSLFTACYFAADFDRAASWAAALRRHGIIGPAPGGQIFLSNHCDSVHATLLCELGRFGEAEAVLARAIADFEAAMPGGSWHAAIALADLRIRQGRFADAETLLLGKDGHLQALLPMARLHLARGDHELARVTARRGLRLIGADRLRAAELLAVLVEAELAAGDHEGAVAASADLDARTRDVAVPALRARSAAVQARVLAAGGDLAGGIAVLEAAADSVTSAGTPWLHASLLLESAHLREQAGDRAAAIVDAKAAAATLAGLDVVVSARDRALLDRLGAEMPAAPAGNPVVTATLTRDGRVWVAAAGDTRVRLTDTKGFRYLGELVSSPGIERHALDLVDRVEGVAGSSGADRRHLGDAGELLDSQARSAYRHRIEQLRAEVDGALGAGDDRLAEARQYELDQLVGQLAQAFGLGGRSRKAASAAERARLNVTRALRSATARLIEAFPEAGGSLDRSIRTGMYCVYDPGDVTEVLWVVHP